LQIQSAGTNDNKQLAALDLALCFTPSKKCSGSSHASHLSWGAAMYCLTGIQLAANIPAAAAAKQSKCLTELQLAANTPVAAAAAKRSKCSANTY
jgi:hypothetical protein